ncbi:MAG: extracellular solute-binding protein [Clostridiaceae bacterium]|nr:extracellular solute-binding protein [Clostridiaceae bacterium]
MKKVLKPITLILVFSLLFLAGCGSTQQPPDEPDTPSPGVDDTDNTQESTEDSNLNPVGEYPIVKEKVTLKVLIPNDVNHPKDINEIPIVQRAEEITNVHIEWIMPGTGFEEKKSLMLATGDLPDFIISGVTEAEQIRYGSEGTLIPLNDLIDQYAPNLQKVFATDPQVRPYITAPDGNMYSTPRINAGPWMRMAGIGAINKTWLDNLGLDMPTTLDEFYDVLKAFKTDDPNENGEADEIPMTFNASISVNFYMGFSYFFSAFGFNPNTNHRDVIDGEVVLTAALPQYKEAIKYINKLYSEGLLDVEGFTNTIPQWSAKLAAEPLTVGYATLWDLNDDIANKNNADQFEYMPPLKNDGYTFVANNSLLPGYDRSGAVITKACEEPEVAIRYIDYIYETNNSLEWIEGEIGERLIEQPEGYYVIADPPEGMTAQQYRAASTPGGSACWAVFEDTYRNVLRLTYTDRKVQFMDDYILEHFDEDPCPPLFYSQEEADAINQLNVDMMAYIERKSSEWIMNGTIDEEWDSYLNELDKMGLQEWLKVNNEAYQRYINQ